MVFDDRRRGVLLTGDRDMFIASIRIVSRTGRQARTTLATAGDCLTLERIRWRGGPAGEDWEAEFLCLREVDPDGRFIASILFDLDDRRAASAEMLERYARSDAARSIPAAWFELRRATIDHDLERYRAATPRDFVFHDHRRIGPGRVEAADFIAWMAALFERSPDAIIEPLYLIAEEKHGTLAVAHTFGTLTDGGEFESVFVQLALFQSGQLVGAEVFEPEHLDAARARFEELRPDPLRIPPNAATRASDRFAAALAARDMNELTALCAPTMVFDDRRRGVLLTGDRDMFIASIRIVSRTGRQARTTLATAGDCLTLERIRWRGGPAGEDWEAEFLGLREVDPDDRLIASILFDLDDRRAASAELATRYARSADARWTPAARSEFTAAIHDRDLVRARAALPDDFVFDDHRRTGAGRVEGADAYIGWLASLYEQSSDAIMERLYVVAAEKHGTLSVGRTFGTIEGGGPFESFWVDLQKFEHGRFVGLELFEAEHLDVARARFEELRPDPLRIPPNAASRARDRTGAAFAACNWPALRTLVSDDFVFDDRRKIMALTGDVELWIKSQEVVSSSASGVRVRRDLIGTVGERIAIERVLWTGRGPEGGEFEAEGIMLSELDADGRLRASINFDLDDRRAAFAEAQARFVAGEAAAVGGQTPIAALFRAYRQYDWVGQRASLADDLTFRDHRTLGLLGTLGGDEWVESLRIQADLAPDVAAERLQILAWNCHGRVDVTRVFGTMREGGPFENVFVDVIVTGGDRIRRFEIFDVGAADQALARFAELCAERRSPAA
jgi:ketosteroid isomerase-like protein